MVSLLETLQREHPDVEIAQVGRTSCGMLVSKLDHQVLNEILAKPPRLLKLLRPICRRRRGLHGKDDSRIREGAWTCSP